MNKLSAPVLASILLFILIISFSCNTPTSPPQKNSGTISLSLLEASCTEAWINLKTDGVTLPVNLNLLKDDTVAQTISLGQEDTTIYIASLLPNKIYSIQASTQSSNQSQVTSNKISVRTLTTTSNNFTWQTWTFGDDYAGSSSLSDVAIVGNEIWAVGAIYMNDSTGKPDPKPYNLTIWNGNKWELKQIPFVYNGKNFYGPIYSILALSESDVWLGIGNMIHWNGQVYASIEIPSSAWGPSIINKIWGSSSNDLYIVGNSGSIAHYKDGVWSKIQSGVTLQFLDIYGTADTQTGNLQILAVCTQNYPGDRGIFKIEGNTATALSYYPIQYELYGLWFVPNRHYYVVGSGIYEKNLLSENAWRNGPLDITRYGTTKIRGNGLNDIFAVGSFGEFLHFNGINWKSFIGSTGLPSGSYAGVAVKGNLVIAVGENNSKAIITLGGR